MFDWTKDPFIKRVTVHPGRPFLSDYYPFSLPAVSRLEELSFHPKVTFFVGENGSGKSTILEAIATLYGFNPEGGTRHFRFSTADSHSELHDFLRLVKGSRTPNDGFFLRAESFYNVASYIDEVNATDFYGGKSLHQQSHGESFMALFLEKFQAEGLYILDEPEAALSPARQMTMIARMHQLAEKGCQFIIATHSPMLLSYPHAKIYEINDGYSVVNYKETEHFRLMKMFLDHPERMLSLLLDSDLPE